MASIIAEAAIDAGFDPVVMVVPSEHDLYRAELGSALVYVEQRERLGTGHALLQAKAATQGHDNLIVINGDLPLIRSETLVEMSRAHIWSEAPITLMTANLQGPEGLGQVQRDSSGRIVAVVEQMDVSEASADITEINAGVYCFQSSWLWGNLPGVEPSSNGELFLTDLVSAAVDGGHIVESIAFADPDEALGVNTRVELARAESAMRDRIRRHWMLEGVSIPDPASVYIDYNVRLGIDTVVLPNTHLRGDTGIGEECEIGPNSIIADSSIGDRTVVMASVVEASVLENDVHVGPFSHLRDGTHLENDVRIGNFGEVKNSRIGQGTKSGHFSYVGDAQVGRNVNIGAGSVTCNFDGTQKHTTRIGDDAFIGCDTMLVAPVTIGERSYTSTGSVVNRDVPADHGAIGAPARIRAKSSPRDEA